MAFIQMCPAAEPATQTHAMWVYKTDVIMVNAKAKSELFSFCEARHIVDLFWQTHFVPVPGAAKGGAVVIPDVSSVRDFLRSATAHGLRIHTLSGDPSYVVPKNYARALARVDATLAFNRAAPDGERFAGVHFDVEPHGLKAWKAADNDARCELLTHLVEVSALAAERLHTQSPGIAFGADVTFWFDKTKADGSPVYPVTFRGVTKDATKHLLDLADNVGIMSYRNTAEGRNGITSLVRQTIAYADTAHGRAFVGVKMADIGPPMEGFFGSTEEEMMTALQPLKAAYETHRGYAGIAFFHYDAYRVMPRQ